MTSGSNLTTLLGFDYGRKRIGVAVGQRITCSATPLLTIAAYNGKPDWAVVSRIVKEWNPGGFVVGIPYHMDGSEQAMTRAALRFCRQLKDRYGLPVYEAEERLSSYIVESNFVSTTEPGSKTDPFAAQVILQDWLRKDLKK